MSGPPPRFDYQSSIEFAADKAAAKARLEKTEEAVRKMILRGYADAEICDVLEVTHEYIAKTREAIESETSNR